MSRLVLSNPLIRRYRFSLLRPSNLWIYLAIYVSVVILLLFINGMSVWVSEQMVLSDVLYRRLYTQFLVVEAIILWVWATFNSGAALRDEHLNKTYDFFRLLPLSAVQKVCGILLGRNLLALLFAAISFVPLILFGSLAGLNPSLQGQIVLLLLSVALFSNAVILLSSAVQTRWKAQTRPAVWILLAVLFAPFFLSPLFVLFGSLSREEAVAGHAIPFYGVEVPAILLVALLALYAGLWCILGIVRKFRLEDEPLFSRIAALLFLSGYEVIAIGLFLPHLPDPRNVAYPLWLLVSLVPVVLIPLGSLRTFNSYLEFSGSSPFASRSPLAALLTRSNIALGFGLFVVWAVFSAFMAVVNQTGLPRFLLDGVSLFSFCCVLFLLLELHVVYVPVYSKIGLFLGFLALMYLGLPLILSLVLRTSRLYFYSLFGFFGYLFSSWKEPDATIDVAVSVVNGLLCIIPALLVAQRYRRILALKQEPPRLAPEGIL
jgi:hypothetical protein